jgi:hypothetical protein
VTAAADLASAADALLGAHHAASPLVLPNVWDAASARIVEAGGFPFVATSSHAIAGVLGGRDDDSADPDVVFSFLARIARSVSVPITADVERGYGLPPAELVDRLFEAGMVGCNLEDTDHHGDGVLVDAEVQASFLAEVRAAAQAAGVHLVINARVDTVIRQVGDQPTQMTRPRSASSPTPCRARSTSSPGPADRRSRAWRISASDGSASAAAFTGSSSTGFASSWPSWHPPRPDARQPMLSCRRPERAGIDGG